MLMITINNNQYNITYKCILYRSEIDVLIHILPIICTCHVKNNATGHYHRH